MAPVLPFLPEAPACIIICFIYTDKVGHFRKGSRTKPWRLGCKMCTLQSLALHPHNRPQNMMITWPMMFPNLNMP